MIARPGHKRKYSDDEDSDTEQQQNEVRSMTNVQQVQDTIDKLKTKYGSSYTQMQFRIWAELIVGGMCSTLLAIVCLAELVLEAEQVKGMNHVTQALTDVITAALSGEDNHES